MDNNQFPGYTSTATGLTRRPNSTKEEWEATGRKIAEMDRRWQWYIGDWLLDGEEKGYIERGKHKEACLKFGIAYNTSAHAVGVCRATESWRRRQHLSFTHHREVANRPDAHELLDWCEEEHASIRQLRKEKKRRDKEREKSPDNEGDTSFDFGDNVDITKPPPHDKRGVDIPPHLQEAFEKGQKTIGSLARKVSLLKGEIEEACDGPGCDLIPKTAVTVSLKEAYTNLKHATPYKVCKCKGFGCAICEDKGWLHQMCAILYDDGKPE